MLAATITAASAAPSAQSTLRALGWSEIVARLAAARDLRRVLACPPVDGGSFAPRAAAGIRHCEERSVNLDALAPSKWAAAMTAASAAAAGFGDRDN